MAIQWRARCYVVDTRKRREWNRELDKNKGRHEAELREAPPSTYLSIALLMQFHYSSSAVWVNTKVRDALRE
jgi:hypothetical protein